MALRGLVAFFHVAQPLVRTWARVFSRVGRIAPDPGSLPGQWSGDRLVWVRRLYRKLAQRQLQVGYGGPHDAWDLKVSAGPFLQGRLTTAVAWNWVPYYRLSLWPAPGLLITLAGVAVLGLFALPIAFVVLGGIAVGVLVETVRLRRAAAHAIEETTEGAA